MSPRRSPRPVARCLCGSCGLRFSSTRAFDAHRAFAFGCKGDWGARECLSPSEIEGFEAIEGICRLTGETVRPVRIWGLTEHREQARVTFRPQERQARERVARASESNRGNAERVEGPITSTATLTQTQAQTEPSELPAETGAAK